MQALIDCGATGCFIDIEWAKLNNIPTRPLTNPIPVYNFDGTANDAGMITDITDVVLRYDNHSERTQLAVTRLGKQSMILGYNWLCNHNPEINWQTKEVQTERVNQELEGYLHIFTSRRQDDWDELLPLGEFSHNNHVHLLTQQTPFMVDTGRHPHMGFEPQQPRSKMELVNEFADRMAVGIEEVKSALTKAKDEYAMYYNRCREPAPVFTQGDRVWLDGSDITTNRLSSKVSH
jgi:hypothetical protein